MLYSADNINGNECHLISSLIPFDPVDMHDLVVLWLWSELHAAWPLQSLPLLCKVLRI